MKSAHGTQLAKDIQFIKQCYSNTVGPWGTLGIFLKFKHYERYGQKYPFGQKKVNF